MIIENNLKNWEGVQEVLIFHTSDMDTIFAARIAYETIRTKYNVENITLSDITTKWPVPAVCDNPRDDLMVVYIGRIPSMVHLDQTIELVGANHVTVLINDPVYNDYLHNYSHLKEMCGLMINEASLYELSYLFFKEGARFCDRGCQYKIIVGNQLVVTVNGGEAVDSGDTWAHGRQRLKAAGYLNINEAFNDAIQQAELHPGTADNINLYLGMLSELPSITDSEAPFWEEIYKDKDDMEEATNIAIYTALGKSCRHMFYKDNINAFRDFAFQGKIRKFTNWNVVAINTPFQGAYTFAREEIFNKYDIGVEFCYNGLMHYKIYRLGANPTLYVPMKNIAKAFGGSGNDYVGYFRTTGQLEISPVGFL